MRIKKIIIHQLKIPFKHAFATAQFNHVTAHNIVVKVETDTGIYGYGECTPRSYVTGEDIGNVVNRIKTDFAPYLIGQRIENIKEAESILSRLSAMNSMKNDFFPGSALCALDLAIYDALGSKYNSSTASLLGGDLTICIKYTKGIPLINGEILNSLLNYIDKYRMDQVKVKVGSSLGADIERLRMVREHLGERVDLRIDANCQWSPREAIERINIFEEFNISCVEQPVAANDFRGMAMVKKNVAPAIIADESACSYENIRELIDLNACDIINIKLSKCGGLYSSLQILNLAKGAGKDCLLGYHIGETGLLEAADRVFALVAGGLKYMEGAISPILLAESIVHQDVGFDEFGQASALPGAGLGVTVNESVLAKYSIFREGIG